MKGRIFGIGERYEFESGAGATLGQSVMKYPETIVIRRGIIEARVDVTHRVEVLMFNFSIEQQFRINERFFVGLNATYRTTFQERHVLERRVNFDNGYSFISGIRSVATCLQIGYIF